MNNTGDVLTLADGRGAVHSRISWGDCADTPCASEHIAGSLGIDQSVVRSPELRGAWVPHTSVAADSRFSPGRRADAIRFERALSPPKNLQLEGVGFVLSQAK